MYLTTRRAARFAPGLGCDDCGSSNAPLGQVVAEVTRCPTPEELQPLLERLQSLEASIPRAELMVQLGQPGAADTLAVILRDVDWLRALFQQLADAGCTVDQLPPLEQPATPPPPPGTTFESYLWNGIGYLFPLGHGAPDILEVEQAEAARAAGILPLDSTGRPVADYTTGELAVILLPPGEEPAQPTTPAPSRAGMLALAGAAVLFLAWPKRKAPR